MSNIEDVNLCVRPMLFDEKGVLELSVIGANVAAIGVATLAPRAYALMEKGHLLGPLTIGGRVSSRDDGPAHVNEALEFQGGDHIRGTLPLPSCQ